MLVLSRRPNQKVIFPNLGISIQVIRVAGKAVRLGIDAPEHLRILREEVVDPSSSRDGIPTVLSRQQRHALRNRLNVASLSLHLLHRQLEYGKDEDAEPTLRKLFQELHEIDAELRPATSCGRESQSARPRRALIVEDNANESELLAAFLSVSGYHVDKVNDGRAALSYLDTNERPDAVLLDMCMPRLDGPSTVDSIRSEPRLRPLKLFAVSGATQHELGVDVGPDGVDHWFSKPVDAPQLVREMNRVLDEAMTA